MNTFRIYLNQKPRKIRIKDMGMRETAVNQNGMDISELAPPDEMELLMQRISLLETALQTSREESFKSGMEEGQAAARSEFKKELSQLAQQFQESLAKIEERYSQQLTRLQEPLQDMALEVGTMLLGCEMRSKEDYAAKLQRQLAGMLNEVLDQSRVVIRINPELLGHFSALEQNSDINLAHHRTINFVGDKSMPLGECILDTPDYVIENLITRHLELIRNALQESDKS